MEEGPDIVKVLHVEAGRHLYGGALQVMFLMRGLQERGIENVLACPRGSGIAEAGHPFGKVVPMAMRGDGDLGIVSRLKGLIASERPDIVHLHSRRGIDVWGAIAARSSGVPVVLSRRVDNREPPWLARLKYRLYHRVITISRGIADVLVKEGVKPDRIVCVPSAVDTSQYHPLRRDLAWFREEFSLPADAFTIGMAAQFIPRKGHQTLLAAVPAVVARHPNARVLLFGQGPLKEALERQIKNSPLLSRHVVIAGFRKDLDRVLPNLEVLAHPASMEGLGVALLQAAACEVPIVAGRAGGIPEIVHPGINGELIEPGDEKALGQHLADLLADELKRRRYGRAGRVLVERQYSVSAMVDGNLQVYREVLGSEPT